MLLVILGLIGGGSEPPAPADATTGAAPAPDASPDPAPTAAPSTTAKPSPTPTPSPTAKPTPKPTPTNPYGPQPPQEAQFIKLAKTAMSDYENASNDLKAGAALSTRNRNLCQLLGAGRVAGWTGTVTTLDSNGDGYGNVGIEIAPNMELGTWNNAFSDVTDNTLIKPGPLFDKVINLEEGQERPLRWRLPPRRRHLRKRLAAHAGRQG